MFKKFFKYLKYKFFKKKYKYSNLIETSLSISYIEFEYIPDGGYKYKKSNFQFKKKSDYFL
jgi:hypothetical protein